MQDRENQVIYLMITDGKKWHYLAVKKLPALLTGITSKYFRDFYCLNCLHNNPKKSSTTKINEHITSGCSTFTLCSFDATKNRFDCYRSKYCMDRFSKDLK